jgi:F-type H+-transporting ATPase subunit delta
VIKGSLAKRYARALMEIGQEKGIYERLGKELFELEEQAKADASLRLVLSAPIVGKDQREKIVVEISRLLGFHEVMLQFLKLLNLKGRLPYLGAIAEAYRDLADEAEGRVRASVTVAAPVSGEGEARIKDALIKLTGKQVIMDVNVDQDLIGGVVARVAGKLLDGSVRTQLRAMEERLKTE